MDEKDWISCPHLSIPNTLYSTINFECLWRVFITQHPQWCFLCTRCISEWKYGWKHLVVDTWKVPQYSLLHSLNFVSKNQNKEEKNFTDPNADMKFTLIIHYVSLTPVILNPTHRLLISLWLDVPQCFFLTSKCFDFTISQSYFLSPLLPCNNTPRGGHLDLDKNVLRLQNFLEEVGVQAGRPICDWSGNNDVCMHKALNGNTYECWVQQFELTSWSMHVKFKY